MNIFLSNALAGIVPNVRGRVLSHASGNHSQIEKGLYVCGWLKRGPTGIIGTNLYCAEETVCWCSFIFIFPLFLWWNWTDIALYDMYIQEFLFWFQLCSIHEDLESQELKCTSSSLQKPGREGLLQLLDSRNVRVVPYGGWVKIDNEEKRQGMLQNKPREKLTSWDLLMKIAVEWIAYPLQVCLFLLIGIII